MKKVFLMAAMMVATVAASAQVYIGGGINFGTHKDSYVDVNGAKAPDAETSFGISPEVGYKLNDKWAVGIALGYDHSKQGDDKNNKFSIMPYARYTFVKWNRVGLFADAQFKFYSTKYTTKDITGYNETTGEPIYGDVDDKTTGWNIGIRPGISVGLTDKLTFITKVGWLGYGSEKPDGENMKASSDFGLNVDLTNVQFSLLFDL